MVVEEQVDIIYDSESENAQNPLSSQFDHTIYNSFQPKQTSNT